MKSTTTGPRIELPLKGKGVEIVSLPAVDEAFKEWLPLKDERNRICGEEADAKKRVMDLLRENSEQLGATKNGTIRYQYEDKRWTLKHGKDKLKSEPVEARPTTSNGAE